VVRTALVLAETAPGRAEDIANLIRHVAGIKAVHIVSESYGAIALVEAGDSDGIRDIASRIALTPSVVRCVVCSERELADPMEVNGFAGMLENDYSCWCVREPASGNLRPLCPDAGRKPTRARNI
jgi:hypothetical protein